MRDSPNRLSFFLGLALGQLICRRVLLGRARTLAIATTGGRGRSLPLVPIQIKFTSLTQSEGIVRPSVPYWYQDWQKTKGMVMKTTNRQGALRIHTKRESQSPDRHVSDHGDRPTWTSSHLKSLQVTSCLFYFRQRSNLQIKLRRTSIRICIDGSDNRFASRIEGESRNCFEFTTLLGLGGRGFWGDAGGRGKSIAINRWESAEKTAYAGLDSGQGGIHECLSSEKKEGKEKDHDHIAMNGVCRR